MSGLVLSLFPGIGLLDMAFEEVGFCVVRGPDLLWGGDIRRFHPPAGRFEGVIGGPPCQAFSPLANLSGHHENLIPEFERVVTEAAPTWFLMENVRQAPVPLVAGYWVCERILNNRWTEDAPPQNRVRRFSFGTHDGRELHPRFAALESVRWESALTAAHPGERRTHFNRGTGGRLQRYTTKQALELQGLPPDFFDRFEPECPLKDRGKLKLLANGVPLPLGRAVARAVLEATRPPQHAEATSIA